MGAGLAMLIARRAVDGYYTRFGFWGLSQYSKVTLNISTIPPICPSSCVVHTPLVEEDFGACTELYAGTYRELIGHCVRNQTMWDYINCKLPYLSLKCDVFRVKGVVEAYLIHDSQGNVYEIGLIPGGPSCGAKALLRPIMTESGNFTLHLPPTHPFLATLKGADVSLTIRECPYGGHMVRILKPTLIRGPREQELDGGSASKTARFLCLDETAALLRLTRVTNIETALEFGSNRSFNIPLMDQI